MVWVTARRALFFVLGVFAVGSIYRAAHFHFTAFFVPDEWGYAYVHLGDFGYQGRQFFNIFNWLTLPRGVDNLILAMPFYFMFWLSLGLVSAYGTMKLLGHEDRTIAITLLLSLSIPVFLLFSVSILTETVAFAMTMLGIYFTIWFIKNSNSSKRYLGPILAALCFVAADYTRVDFIIFQVLGFLPFVVSEAKRSKNLLQVLKVFALFAIPALFFLYYPNYSALGTSQAVASVLTVSSIPTTTTNATTIIISTLKNGTVQTVTQTITQQIATIKGIPTVIQPTGNIHLNFIRVLGAGIFLGFNPVVGLLVSASFFMTLYLFLRKHGDILPAFWFGLLGLGTLTAASFIYMVVPNLPLSTVIRYSYDALPAYFMLIPFLLARIKRKSIYALIMIGLAGSAGLATVSYQAALQSNLGGSYPYLNGNQPFLALDYRTPYAQMRDYFHNHPSSQYIVVGEPKKGYFNMTYDWKFTPGVSDLNVTFYRYNETAGLTHFYLYIEPNGNTSSFWKHDWSRFHFEKIFSLGDSAFEFQKVDLV